MKNVLKSIGFLVLCVILSSCNIFKPSPPAEPEFPAGITWIHGPDISGWSVTAKLSASMKRVSATKISVILNSDKANVWPEQKSVDGSINANTWVVFQAPNGKWYASTWEWLRKGMITRTINGPFAGYIKKADVVSKTWNPATGSKIGLMVSGPARDNVAHTVEERSNVIWLNWP